MKLKKFLKAANGRICGGTEYQWDCFPNGQYTDVSDLDGNEIGGCIYNRLSMKVYQVEVHVYDDEVSYRWTNPEWEQAYEDEASKRNVDPINAYDHVNYTIIDDEDEILHLLSEVVHMTYVHSKPIKPVDEPKMEDIKSCLNPSAAWPFSTNPNLTGLVGETKKTSPSSAWPFPVGNPDSNEDDDLDGTDADWGHDDEDVDAVNELLSEASRDDGFDIDEFNHHADVESCCVGNGCCGEREVPETDFEVTLTVRHRFAVSARNMEQAIDKARLFQKDMKSGVWPKGLIWEDQWVSKTAVTHRLETTHIED